MDVHSPQFLTENKLPVNGDANDDVAGQKQAKNAEE